MVRELFIMAREHAPSIIFMDEIDSIGSSRGESGSGGGDSEVQRTMLELLNQLDGFESTKNIKVGTSDQLHSSIPLLSLHDLTVSSPWYRSSWLQIELISSTRHFYDQVVSTGRSNSHLRDQKLEFRFYAFTAGKCPFKEESICVC